MKKNRNILDEMQEKKLLKIEHNTLTITGIGLLVAIFVQEAIGNTENSLIAGESIVLFISSLYMLIACIKNGIWGRTTKQPNMKKNTFISLLVSFIFAFFWAIVSYVRYNAWISSLLIFVMMFLVMFMLTMVLFTTSTMLYKYSINKIEQQADKDENSTIS